MPQILPISLDFSKVMCETASLLGCHRLKTSLDSLTALMNAYRQPQMYGHVSSLLTLFFLKYAYLNITSEVKD